MKLFICALLFSGICFGQNQTNQKLIVVEGQAKMLVRPDIALLTLTLEKVEASPSMAMAKANLQIEALVTLLTRQGIDKKQIKITDYNISNSFNNSKKVKEYTIVNTIKVTMPSKGDRINQLLKAIELKQINDLDVSFDYQLSDSLEKERRTALIQQAIQQAKKNAEDISATLKITLKSIVQITKAGLSTFPIPQLETAKFAPPKTIGQVYDQNSIFQDLEVEEKELQEQIIITYEIQ